MNAKQKQRSENQKTRMRLNTKILIEETQIKIKLRQEKDPIFKLEMLSCFRPNASLRQINNTRQLNFG